MDPNIAWAAGIFEGEGTWGLHLKHSTTVTGEERTYANISAAVGMTDVDVVRRFHQVVHVGKVYGPYHNPPHKDQHRWMTWGLENVERIFTMFEPWLGVRRLNRGREILQVKRDMLPPEGWRKAHRHTDETKARMKASHAARKNHGS